MRQKILIVVPPDRFDFYNYLAEIKEVDFILLWYTDPDKMKVDADQLPLHFERIVFWNQFRTPRALIKKLRPDKIVFFEIIDLRQISLIVTAKKMKVRTFYLEHGAAGDKETAKNRWQETTFVKHKVPYYAKRIKNSTRDIFFSKLFYYSVVGGFQSIGSYFKYLALPFKMLFDPPNKVLTHTIFKERVPDCSIVFNKSNYDEYALYTGISEQEALLSGVPFFDRYFCGDVVEHNHIVYIEQPYLEPKLLNWTKEHHKRIADNFSLFAKKTGIKVYIKLHPITDAALWQDYFSDNDRVEIIQHGDFTDIFLSSKLILGYSSSLINAFLCARKNVVLLGWHPQPQIFGSDFSKTGLCHVSLNPCDLNTKFESWCAHNLASENESAYEKFLLLYNCPFDGKATQRVLEAITELKLPSQTTQ
jgi:hypothetical protein